MVMSLASFFRISGFDFYYNSHRIYDVFRLKYRVTIFVYINNNMAASARQQKELQIKARQALATTTDPIERLRAACLARGAQGIKGLSMYDRIAFLSIFLIFILVYFV
jgi:hypothetical protein